MNLDFIDSKEFNAFLEQYGSSDPIKLRLKKFSGLTFDLDFAITQISCRQKARRKLPELGERLIYPTAVSIEQCTSEAVARLHGTLFADCRNVYDLTCGLGIDAYYIARNARHVACCDINPEVAATARHNFNRLGASNIEVECRDAVDASLSLNGYDACFVDPSRRGETASMRLYSFADCTPNLKTIVDNIRSAVKFIIVKGSPMVDIAQTIKEYPETTDIWVVSVKNDCKELLFKIDFTSAGDEPPTVRTINYESDRVETFHTRFSTDPETATYAHPQEGKRLFVPNASVMKSRQFSQLSDTYGISKISPDTALFVGDTAVECFPGKQYVVERILSLSKPDIKQLRMLYPAADITCRHFPLSAAELRKRLKISEGGNVHIYATTCYDNRHVLLVCRR